MAINRFDQAVQVDTRTPIYRPDWNVMAGVLQNLQQEVDVYDEVRSKFAQAINKDAQARQALQTEYEDASSLVTDAYVNQGVSAGRQALAQTQQSIIEDWSPGGRQHALERRFAEQQARTQEIAEMYEDPYDRAYASILQQKGTQSVYDQTSGIWDVNASIGAINSPKYIDPQERTEMFNKMVSGLKDTLLSSNARGELGLKKNAIMQVNAATKIVDFYSIDGVTYDRISEYLMNNIPEQFKDYVQFHHDAMRNAFGTAYNPGDRADQRDLATYNSNGEFDHWNLDTVLGRQMHGLAKGHHHISRTDQFQKVVDPYMQRKMQLQAENIFMAGTGTASTNELSPAIVRNKYNQLANLDEQFSKINTEIKDLQARRNALDPNSPTRDKDAAEIQQQIDALVSTRATNRQEADQINILVKDVERQAGWDSQKQFEAWKERVYDRVLNRGALRNLSDDQKDLVRSAIDKMDKGDYDQYMRQDGNLIDDLGQIFMEKTGTTTPTAIALQQAGVDMNQLGIQLGYEMDAALKDQRFMRSNLIDEHADDLHYSHPSTVYTVEGKLGKQMNEFYLSGLVANTLDMIDTDTGAHIGNNPDLMERIKNGKVQAMFASETFNGQPVIHYSGVDEDGEKISIYAALNAAGHVADSSVEQQLMLLESVKQGQPPATYQLIEDQQNIVRAGNYRPTLITNDGSTQRTSITEQFYAGDESQARIVGKGTEKNGVGFTYIYEHNPKTGNATVGIYKADGRTPYLDDSGQQVYVPNPNGGIFFSDKTAAGISTSMWDMQAAGIQK